MKPTRRIAPFDRMMPAAGVEPTAGVEARVLLLAMADIAMVPLALFGAHRQLCQTVLAPAAEDLTGEA